MKILILAFSFLFTLVSGLTLPGFTTCQAQTIKLTLAVNIEEDSPNSAFGNTSIPQVICVYGLHNVQALISFNLLTLSGKTYSLAFFEPATLTSTGWIQIFRSRWSYCYRYYLSQKTIQEQLLRHL
ncbi:hypothetical protein L873DRAFT_1803406 [Choiromyces venosus 120613-1]|uniref:Uncharacterized protein n=1 Tax=Choiromyces venosus 120613-1 TaxID=1336337 RepID=A0A3N4K6S2_9PEZI|nr:hypothetical protein L873DRAFT_1803406 [Choiromyces venosus 120613-1]